MDEQQWLQGGFAVASRWVWPGQRLGGWERCELVLRHHDVDEAYLTWVWVVGRCFTNVMEGTEA